MDSYAFYEDARGTALSISQVIEMKRRGDKSQIRRKATAPVLDPGLFDLGPSMEGPGEDDRYGEVAAAISQANAEGSNILVVSSKTPVPGVRTVATKLQGEPLDVVIPDYENTIPLGEWRVSTRVPGEKPDKAVIAAIKISYRATLDNGFLMLFAKVKDLWENYHNGGSGIQGLIGRLKYGQEVFVETEGQLFKGRRGKALTTRITEAQIWMDVAMEYNKTPYQFSIFDSFPRLVAAYDPDPQVRQATLAALKTSKNYEEKEFKDLVTRYEDSTDYPPLLKIKNSSSPGPWVSNNKEDFPPGTTNGEILPEILATAASVLKSFKPDKTGAVEISASVVSLIRTVSISIKMEVYSREKYLYRNRAVYGTNIGATAPMLVLLQAVSEATPQFGTKENMVFLKKFNPAKGMATRLLTLLKKSNSTPKYLLYSDNMYCYTTYTTDEGKMLTRWISMDGTSFESSHSAAKTGLFVVHLLKKVFGVVFEEDTIAEFIDYLVAGKGRQNEASAVLAKSRFKTDQVISPQWINYFATASLAGVNAVAGYGMSWIGIKGMVSGMPQTFTYNSMLMQMIVGCALTYQNLQNVEDVHLVDDKRAERIKNQTFPSVLKTMGAELPYRKHAYNPEKGGMPPGVQVAQKLVGARLKVELETTFPATPKNMPLGIHRLDLLGYDLNIVEIFGERYYLLVLNEDRLLKSLVFPNRPDMKKLEEEMGRKPTEAEKDLFAACVKIATLRTLYVIGGWAYPTLSEIIATISTTIYNENIHSLELVAALKGAVMASLRTIGGEEIDLGFVDVGTLSYLASMGPVPTIREVIAIYGSPADLARFELSVLNFELDDSDFVGVMGLSKVDYLANQEKPTQQKNRDESEMGEVALAMLGSVASNRSERVKIRKLPTVLPPAPAPEGSGLFGTQLGDYKSEARPALPPLTLDEVKGKLTNPFKVTVEPRTADIVASYLKETDPETQHIYAKGLLALALSTVLGRKANVISQVLDQLEELPMLEFVEKRADPKPP